MKRAEIEPLLSTLKGTRPKDQPYACPQCGTVWDSYRVGARTHHPATDPRHYSLHAVFDATTWVELDAQRKHLDDGIPRTCGAPECRDAEADIHHQVYDALHEKLNVWRASLAKPEAKLGARQ